MKGYGADSLLDIDVELKEAVCDAVVNSVVNRVSGTDEEGRTIFGKSPRRFIVSGQLLPRYDIRGDDETSDIAIAALGLDFSLASGATEILSASPKFSVYLRVLPSWEDIDPDGGPLEFDFRLNRELQTEIDMEIRTNRVDAFKTAGVDRPNWQSMDETERSATRQRRAAIQEEVRTAAYAKHQIKLTADDFASVDNDVSTAITTGQENVDINTPDSEEMAATPISRLVREGREIPFSLIEPAPIPAKWKRLDLDLPDLQWRADLTGLALTQHVADYCSELSNQLTVQLQEWLTNDGKREAWRDASVRPENTQNEKAWNEFLQEVRKSDPNASTVLPDLSCVVLKIERQTEFLNPERVSFRVSLDNQSQQLSPLEARSVCNAIFGTSLRVRLPASVHRPLQLDRVEPSYRFRNYLNYPAIGLNCGVKSHAEGENIVLDTTWSPRFVQPRILPTKVEVETRFGKLSQRSFNPELIAELPRAYEQWIETQSTNLQQSVRQGLPSDEADSESERLNEDLQGQRVEASFIARGIELLVESAEAAERYEKATTEDERSSHYRRAIPWFAWTMTNDTFFRRYDRDSERGWRLFQLAFILAHIPTLVSRMEEFRDYSDNYLDDESASLLYFPTGGGKSEAFYGSLLFALFLDRLRGKERGISAIVRYPLRLLTLQQAQRLLKLIAWAELVRSECKIGSWPFEIGFWVGSANTPNTYGGIRAEVPRLGDPEFLNDEKLEDISTHDEEEGARARRYRESRDAFNKVPECPICGSDTGLRRYESSGPTARRAAIVCFENECAWNRAHGQLQPLPFLLTDDTIYERAPAVLLGTIDKLAMLGQHTNTISKVFGMFGLARWISPQGHLFAERRHDKLQAGPEAEGFEPVFPAYRRGQKVFTDPFPSLIIQDEAHLLEESLGTFSGLFDSLFENILTSLSSLAGDELEIAKKWTGDSWGAPRMPKVIAATATISNPERQLETLYQRKPLRFPYPGPDIYRSFFSEPAPPPAVNSGRVELAANLSSHIAPEATSPWMRLYVSLMTNDATHTVTAVQVLSAFHAAITQYWSGIVDPAKRSATVNNLRSAITPDSSGDWRRSAIDRATHENREGDIMALIDLHRIALAYVTNKKGGDQIMDALDTSVHQIHQRFNLPFDHFDSRLISGGVDMKEIQQVMADAEESFSGEDYPVIDKTVRNIVATSAISHGVDVDRFNSMFFAGLPSDIAEYIQASSRVGRTHVGFVLLIPTPQSRRDRYVVETHDIFHRFLERMIAPPAVERWAENAIRRVLASYVQAWVMLKESEEFMALADDQKTRLTQADMISRLKARASHDMVGFQKELGNFVLRSTGFEGHGPSQLGRPPYADHYSGLVDYEIGRFADAMTRQATSARLAEYWEDLNPVFQKPMTSLRDVDEAGFIVASGYDPHSTGKNQRINVEDLTNVMRAIRSQRGEAAETDADGGVER